MSPVVAHDKTVSTDTAYVEATEAPDDSTDTVETKQPSRATSASKNAQKTPQGVTVSVDNTTLDLDADAPPREQTE